MAIMGNESLADIKGDIVLCKECRKYDYEKTHVCPPKFKVSKSCSYDAEVETIYAENSRKAAEEYAGGNPFDLFGEPCDVITLYVTDENGKKTKCELESYKSFLVTEEKEI